MFLLCLVDDEKAFWNATNSKQINDEVNLGYYATAKQAMLAGESLHADYRVYEMKCVYKNERWLDERLKEHENNQTEF